jgi:hypothetical protein
MLSPYTARSRLPFVLFELSGLGLAMPNIDQPITRHRSKRSAQANHPVTR